MSYNTIQFRGTFMDPIELIDGSGEEMLSDLQRHFLDLAIDKKLDIYSKFDTVKSGGIFGTKAPMLVIRHPDRFKGYAPIGIVVYKNSVYFHFIGESTEERKAKDLKNRRYGLLGGIPKPNEFKLQDEYDWRRTIRDAINDIIEIV